MKKTYVLIVAALMLSLTGCGSDTMTKEEVSKTATEEEEVSETATVGKKEMLEIAAECDFAAILSAYGDNKVNAKETFCNQVYRFTGYVEEIVDETSVKIIPLNAPVGVGEAYAISVYANLPSEDLRELSTFEVVNMVGKISSLGPYTVHMDNAYYVDNLITFTGTVDGFSLNGNSKQTTIVSDIELIGSNEVALSYKYLGEEVDVSRLSGFDRETFLDVTVREGDSVTMTGNLEYAMTYRPGNGVPFYTREFSVTDVESIEKAE